MYNRLVCNVKCQVTVCDGVTFDACSSPLQVYDPLQQGAAAQFHWNSVQLGVRQRVGAIVL